jgi:hypothetical protein
MVLGLDWRYETCTQNESAFEEGAAANGSMITQIQNTNGFVWRNKVGKVHLPLICGFYRRQAGRMIVERQDRAASCARSKICTLASTLTA